ncbi:hypothetical protein H0H93_006934, partial [Arthromyces matolae]
MEAQKKSNFNEDDQEDETDKPYKAGPIPNEAKDLAHAYQKDYFQKMEALAKKYNKSLQAFFVLVGDVPPPSRRELSQWGVYQAWYRQKGPTPMPDN